MGSINGVERDERKVKGESERGAGRMGLGVRMMGKKTGLESIVSTVYPTLPLTNHSIDQ